jgi:hypothetical protein
MEMHMTSKKTPEIVNSLFWGTFVLLIGATLLGINLGYLSANIWDSLIKLWPILLIVWGLNIVFRHTYLQVLSYLSPLVLIAAFAYATTMTPSSDDNGKWYAPLIHIGDGRSNVPTTDYKFEYKKDPNVTSTELSLKLGGSDVEVAASPAEGFAEVLVTTNVGKPNVNLFADGNVLKIDGETPRSVGRIVNHKDAWTVHLPPGLPTKMTVDAGATDCNLDFSSITLTNLTVKSGASDIDVTMQAPPPEGSKVEIGSGASDVILTVPTGAPLKVKVDSGAVSSNFKKIGLVKKDGYWYSASYLADKPAIEVNIDSGATDISINYK